MLRRGGGRLARQTGAKPPGLPGAASQAYPNPGSTPVSNGGDYETWQMFLRQGQRAEPPAAVGSGVHRRRRTTLQVQVEELHLWRLSQSSSPRKCRFHLGFGLVVSQPRNSGCSGRGLDKQEIASARLLP